MPVWKNGMDFNLLQWKQREVVKFGSGQWVTENGKGKTYEGAERSTLLMEQGCGPQGEGCSCLEETSGLCKLCLEESPPQIPKQVHELFSKNKMLLIIEDEQVR